MVEEIPKASWSRMQTRGAGSRRVGSRPPSTAATASKDWRRGIGRSYQKVLWQRAQRNLAWGLCPAPRKLRGGAGSVIPDGH